MSENFTEAQVLSRLEGMTMNAQAILNDVDKLWQFADRDVDDHPYYLGHEMSAVYHLVDRAQEVLNDLIEEVKECVESEQDDAEPDNDLVPVTDQVNDYLECPYSEEV